MIRDQDDDLDEVQVVLGNILVIANGLREEVEDHTKRLDEVSKKEDEHNLRIEQGKPQLKVDTITTKQPNLKQ